MAINRHGTFGIPHDLSLPSCPSRFVLSGSAKNNITEVVTEHFGGMAGHVLTFLYFFAIYPILLMYSIAITNTSESFIIHQLGWQAPPRWVLAIILILGLMTIVRFGQQVIVKFMSVLVYPFVCSLILLSLYLIPHWNTAIFQQSGGTDHSLMMTIWLVIPVMVFSFNHSPIISSFAVSQKHHYGEHADAKSSWILKYSHLLMVSTVMLFVLSCVFSLSPTDLAHAKQQNISILSYLANHFQTPIIAYVAPLIAFVAIAKSFFGHYLGASEGMHGMLTKYFQTSLNKKHLQIIIEVFIIITCWLSATLNPNILKMIETLGGPIIAMLLFLMPMYAVARVPVLQKYKNSWVKNIFITSIGAIAISAIFYGFFYA